MEQIKKKSAFALLSCWAFSSSFFFNMVTNTWVPLMAPQLHLSFLPSCLSCCTPSEPGLPKGVAVEQC